jgi:hypothetical protein
MQKCHIATCSGPLYEKYLPLVVKQKQPPPPPWPGYKLEE